MIETSLVVIVQIIFGSIMMLLWGVDVEKIGFFRFIIGWIFMCVFLKEIDVFVKIAIN